MDRVLGVDGCNAEHIRLGEIDQAAMQRTFGNPSSECLARPEEWSDAPSVVPTFSPVNETVANVTDIISTATPSSTPTDPTLSPSQQPELITTKPTMSPTSLPKGVFLEGEQMVQLASVLITFVRSNHRRRHLQEQAGWLLSSNDERAALLSATSLHLMAEIPYLLATDLGFTRVYTPLADDRTETLALEGKLFFLVRRNEMEHSYFAPTMVRSQVKQAFEEKGAVERYMKALKDTNEEQLMTVQTVYTGFPSLDSSRVGEDEMDEQDFWLQWDDPLWLIFVGCVGSACLLFPLLVCFLCCRSMHRKRIERLRLLKSNQSNETALCTPNKSSEGHSFEMQPSTSNEPSDSTSSEGDKSDGADGDEESNSQQIEPTTCKAPAKEAIHQTQAMLKKDGQGMLPNCSSVCSQDSKLETTNGDNGKEFDSGQVNQPNQVKPDKTSKRASRRKLKKEDLETKGKFGKSVKPQSPSSFSLNPSFTSKSPNKDLASLALPPTGTTAQKFLSGAESSARKGSQEQ